MQTVLTLSTIFEALLQSRGLSASQAGGGLGVDERTVSDAFVDSRRVIPGALFVALPGENVDGHAYVADAFRRGATLALIQRPLPEPFPVLDLRGDSTPHWLSTDAQRIEGEQSFCILVDDCLLALQQIAKIWRSRLDLRVIGITGSVGKSTTKEVVAEVLEHKFRTLKNEGNMNNEIGLPLTLLRLSTGVERAVLEMGFYVPGEIALLCDLAKPVVGVVTNIGTVHAERAGSQEAIARGKAELVEALPADGTAILNFDDPWVRGMAAKTQARVFYYGMTSESELWADQVVGLGLEGIRFRLHYQGQELHVHTPLIGHHSVQTALRAAAVGLVEGMSLEEIAEGLSSSQTQLRLVAAYTPQRALILDDTYNASPESTLAALSLLEEMEGKRIAVLGDMLELGPYEEEGHEKVGLRAAEAAQELITVGSRAHRIAAAARSAGMAENVVKEFETSREAAASLRDRFRQGDVVLIKGSRGVHMENIIDVLEIDA